MVWGTGVGRRHGWGGTWAGGVPTRGSPRPQPFVPAVPGAEGPRAEDPVLAVGGAAPPRGRASPRGPPRGPPQSAAGPLGARVLRQVGGIVLLALLLDQGAAGTGGGGRAAGGLGVDLGGWGPTWGGGGALLGPTRGGALGQGSPLCPPWGQGQPCAHPGVKASPVPTLGSRPALCPPWGQSQPCAHPGGTWGQGTPLSPTWGYLETGDSLVTDLGGLRDRGLPCHRPGGVRATHVTHPGGLMDRVTPLHPLWGILRDRGQRCDQPGGGCGTGDTPHTHLGGRGATRTPSSLPHMPCPPPPLSSPPAGDLPPGHVPQLPAQE